MRLLRYSHHYSIRKLITWTLRRKCMMLSKSWIDEEGIDSAYPDASRDSVSQDLKVASISPECSPGVFKQPVWCPICCCPVSNKQDSVIY
jgi:hypothetical protein